MTEMSILKACLRLGCDDGILMNKLPRGYAIKRHQMSYCKEGDNRELQVLKVNTLIWSTDAPSALARGEKRASIVPKKSYTRRTSKWWTVLKLKASELRPWAWAKTPTRPKMLKRYTYTGRFPTHSSQIGRELPKLCKVQFPQVVLLASFNNAYIVLSPFQRKMGF